MNPARIKQLVQLISDGKDLYYNAENPSPGTLGTTQDGRRVRAVSDKVYEGWETELRSLDPRNPILKSVGAPVPKKLALKKVQLPAYMGSLEKIHANGSTLKWLKSSKGPWTVSDKLDGVSMLAEGQRDGVHLYTRGKGETGFDITLLRDYIWGGTGRLPPGAVIRGELHVDDDSFAEWAEKYANTRALASGIVNSTGRTGIVHAAAGAATFIVYAQVKPERSLAQAGAALANAGWYVVPYKVFARWGVDPEGILTEYLKLRRSKSKYILDGLVITDAEGASIAFKGEDESAIVTVKEVQWAASRFGTLNPVAIFVEPVPLAGVMVAKATAHTAKMVEQFGLGPGAQVTVVRAGSVIPKITGLVRKGRAQFPPPGTWYWDDNHTDIILKKGNATNDAAVATNLMTNFVRTFTKPDGTPYVEGIQLTSMAKIVATGIDTPLKLMRASAQQIAASGIGSVATNNLYTNLRRGLQSATHTDLMIGSGTFAAGWGHRRFALIFDHVTYVQLMKLAAGSSTAFVAALSAIPGMQKTLLQQLYVGCRAYQAWLAKSGLRPKAAVYREPVVEGPLSGHNVVFTKVRDTNLAEQIKKLGGTINDSINSQTLYLVALKGAQSSKTNAAEKRGIKIITVQELKAVLNAKYTKA